MHFQSFGKTKLNSIFTQIFYNLQFHQLIRDLVFSTIIDVQYSQALIYTILIGNKWHFIKISICFSLVMCDIVLFFMFIHMILSVDCLFIFYAHFSIRSFIFFLLIFKSSLHINIFSHFSVLCTVNNFFIFYMSSDFVQVFFLSSIMQSNFQLLL